MMSCKKHSSVIARALCLAVIVALFSVLPASAGKVYVSLSGNDANPGTQMSPKFSPQSAMNAAANWDTLMIDVGTYNGVVTVNKPVHIFGSGSGIGGTILASNLGGSGGVINLSVSGLMGSPILFKDLRIQNTGMAVFSVGTFGGSTGLNLSYFKLSNVLLVGTNAGPSIEQERGVYVDNTSSLHHFTMENCKVINQNYGFYFHKLVGADASTVDYLNVISTEFNHCNSKGVYIEKASNAVFNDCDFTNCGFDPASVSSNFRSGADINLKAGNYSNLKFLNCRFNGNGLGAKEGTGLTVKARNDGSYSSFPATLDGVEVYFCRFTSNERAIRFGEPPPSTTNAGPTNVVVNHCSFIGNDKTYAGIDGSAYGDVINYTLASVEAKNNWWGSKLEPSIIARKYGVVNHTPWLLHDTGDLVFDLTINPAPRITDDFVALNIRLSKDSDSSTATQFDLTVPRGAFMHNDITTTLYSTAGVPVSQLNVARNLVYTDDTVVKYRFVLTPSGAGDFGDEWLHKQIPNDTSMYVVMKLIFTMRPTVAIGDQITFTIDNIITQELNGSPVRATLKGTRIVRSASISYRFKSTGDVDGSGGVADVTDLMLVINHTLEILELIGVEFQEANLNRDEVVNINDIMLLINIINGVWVPSPVASTPLVLEPMNSRSDGQFDVSQAKIVYFTSETPMELPENLPNVEKVWWNDSKTAVSVLFKKPTSFTLNPRGSNVRGTRVGPALTTAVVEDLGFNPVLNSEVSVFNSFGQLISPEHLNNVGSGLYFRVNGQKMEKFVIIK